MRAVGRGVTEEQVGNNFYGSDEGDRGSEDGQEERVNLLFACQGSRFEFHVAGRGEDESKRKCSSNTLVI